MISIHDIQLEDEDEEEEESSMPRFGFDCKKGIGLVDNKQKYGKTYYQRNDSQNGCGLGFIDDEDVNGYTDLNKAIESLDNTQFRNSIKAGSGSKDSRNSKNESVDLINELSHELPMDSMV